MILERHRRQHGKDLPAIGIPELLTETVFAVNSYYQTAKQNHERITAVLEHIASRAYPVFKKYRFPATNAHQWVFGFVEHILKSICVSLNILFEPEKLYAAAYDIAHLVAEMGEFTNEDLDETQVTLATELRLAIKDVEAQADSDQKQQKPRKKSPAEANILEVIGRLKKLAEDNQPPPSLSEIAKWLNVHKSQLSRNTGETDRYHRIHYALENFFPRNEKPKPKRKAR